MLLKVGVHTDLGDHTDVRRRANGCKGGYTDVRRGTDVSGATEKKIYLCLNPNSLYKLSDAKGV